MRIALRPWVLLGCLLCAAGVEAQELEPRAYSPAPVGLNFVLFAGARSTGEVLLDPSVPIQDIEATIDAGVAGYGRTFAIFGHSGQRALAVPYVWADISGNVVEDGEVGDALGPCGHQASARHQSHRRDGADAERIHAAHAEDHARREPRHLAPTGEYYPDKLINIGTNRWAFKPEIGLTIPHDRWMFDVLRRRLAVHRQRRFLWRRAALAGSDHDACRGT